MNKVLLITTIGCKACEIQNNIIHKAIEAYKDKYTIDLISMDVKDYKSLKIATELIDFPTTILIVGDEEKVNLVGTCTKEHLMHLFDEHFIENI